MTHFKWKKVERKIARYLGGERNPLSGGASRHTRGDGILPHPIYLEVKDGKQAGRIHRSRTLLARLFNDTETKAKAEGKIPLVVLHPNGWGGGVRTYPSYIRVQWREGSGVSEMVPNGTVVCVPLVLIRQHLENDDG